MKRCENYQAVLALTILIGSLFMLFGCGGAGSAIAPGTRMISGTAVKGPVNGGTVTAYAVMNGASGMELASGTTDTQGNYHISIGDYTGPLMVQLSGGTYTDEATGVTTTMLPGDVMTAVIPFVSSDATITAIQITPITSMAQAMAHNMPGGMTAANISAASTAIGSHFMVSDILHTQPMNPLVQGSAQNATQDQQNYGMALAAISQYAKNVGMASSSGMVTSMMKDASDGILDGMTGTTPIVMGGTMGTGGSMMQTTAGTTGMATAMQQFMESMMNKSGLGISDMQTLMSNISSDGQLLSTLSTGIDGMMTGGTGTDGMMIGGTGTDSMMTGGTGTGGMMTGTAGSI